MSNAIANSTQQQYDLGSGVRGGVDPSPPASGVASLFTDGFETGDLTHTEGAVAWSTASGSVSVSTSNPKTGLNALNFLYPASTSQTELRFLLGAKYTELWVAYDLFIPLNYYHNNGTNNKGVVHLWEGNYNTPSGPLMGNNNWSDGAGGDSSSYHIFHASGTPDYHVGQFGTGAGNSPNAIILSDRGQWIKNIVHVKYATVANNDGILEHWKVYSGSTQKLHDIHDGAWYVTGQVGFDSGYIRGWANDQFSVDTTFNVDNFEVSETNIWGVS